MYVGETKELIRGQLCGFRAADLRLCFSIYGKSRFSHDVLISLFLWDFYSYLKRIHLLRRLGRQTKNLLSC